MDEQADREQVQILLKMQENLQALQKNGEQLTAALLAQQAQAAAPKTEDEKLQAAYALNLCTVSVSQIIDYNDINFLEREYEAILNNLNLEHMPKDEALLHILKQLLDVITYFRISEGEKELLEKEYQRRMKDAIWSAVPNIGMIVAGGNPVTMAISLASQVGIGYMNYRREKAKAGLEHERSEWELQRSAMEQFNGLRRELFDTAWRLADEYNFPDECRLTERQITQYNKILLDNDPVRKCERLFFMRDKFKAYPPYWYYLGNAANSVYQDKSLPEEARQPYKEFAKGSFGYFLKQTEYNLLREDQLVASCALELFDLTDDTTEKADLLDRAKQASGDAFDVLQLCAMSYLSLGEVHKAADLLRHLVNEDYNAQVNAQLLSWIYVMQTIQGENRRGDYQLLQHRTAGPVLLFPMPEHISQTDAERKALEDDFLQQQKMLLKQEYSLVIEEFILKYGAEYIALCKTNGNIAEGMAALLNRMCSAVKQDAPLFSVRISGRADELGKRFRSMLEAPAREAGSVVRFDELTEKAFEELAVQISGVIDLITGMDGISQAESTLQAFCRDNKLTAAIGRGQEQLPDRTDSSAASICFDKEGDPRQLLQRQRLQDEQLRKCIDVFHKEAYQEKNLLKRNKNGKADKIALFSADTPAFKSYAAKHADLLKAWDKVFEIESRDGLRENIIAVLDDKRMWDKDVLFTTKGVIVVKSVHIPGAAGPLAGFAAGNAGVTAATTAATLGGTVLAAAGTVLVSTALGGLSTAAVVAALRAASDSQKARCQYKEIEKIDDTSLQMPGYVYEESRLNMDIFLQLLHELAEIADRYEKLILADSPIAVMAKDIAARILAPVKEPSYALLSSMR